MEKILWKPSQRTKTHSHMAQFIGYINDTYQTHIKDYAALHQWSIIFPELFWKSIWKFCNVIATQPAEDTILPGIKMQDTRWFQGAKLNFAENLLKRNDDHIALFFSSEHGKQQSLSYTQLRRHVAVIAKYLRQLGVQTGDRVVGFLPNSPETVIAMLATASIGAIWSSCSPDFGLQGLLDRFGQIEPKVLFAVDGHFYNGKIFNHLDKIHDLLSTVSSIKKTIIVSYVEKDPDIRRIRNGVYYNEIITKNKSQMPLLFNQLPFNHPLYILYTSGTTGKPKCIVHGAGGTLLQHLKELMLHTNLTTNDKIFFHTTCGWMMWNWLISSLAIGATVVLYDGAPFYPKPQSLYDLIDELDITVFGVGAKIIELTAKKNLEPINTHRLTCLRSILTTGSPLLPDNFDFIYQKIKKDVCVSSISGGSDIISCFALGNPLLPVYRGELQCIGLGMNVKIFNEKGKSIIEEKGELVCTAPFPSMPIYFWNDPKGEKYQSAYFKKFPNVWAHGDFAKITKHGGMIIYGRSDSTLNPGGVRIGTAEIYNQVEKINEVIECLAIAQRWEGSERIILFVTLRNNTKLTENLVETIKKTIRENTSPHHVPAKIIQVPDLPRTMNGKIAELAVKNVVHNKLVKNVNALENPESLEFFQNISELKT